MPHITGDFIYINMNTRQIQPKSVWLDGEKTATILALANFTDYHFDGGSGKVHYRLVGMEERINEDGHYSVAADYYSGIVEVPSEVINQWGSSDDVIWNFVANELNIQFI